MVVINLLILLIPSPPPSDTNAFPWFDANGKKSSWYHLTPIFPPFYNIIIALFFGGLNQGQLWHVLVLSPFFPISQTTTCYCRSSLELLRGDSPLFPPPSPQG